MNARTPTELSVLWGELAMKVTMFIRKNQQMTAEFSFADFGDENSILYHKITDEDKKVDWLFESARMNYNIQFTDDEIRLIVPTSDITRIEY